MMKDTEKSRMPRADIQCPACRSRDWRVRVKTRDYVCRKCGTVFLVRPLDDTYADVWVKPQEGV